MNRSCERKICAPLNWLNIYDFTYRLQSQVDVDSGIETMEVDELEMRQEAKRRRVSMGLNNPSDMSRDT